MKQVVMIKKIIYLVFSLGLCLFSCPWLGAKLPGITINLASVPENFAQVQSSTVTSFKVANNKQTLSNTYQKNKASCNFTINVGLYDSPDNVRIDNAAKTASIIRRYVSDVVSSVVLPKGEASPLICFIESSKEVPGMLKVSIDYDPSVFTVTKQVSTNPAGWKYVASLNLVITQSNRNLKALSYATPTVFTASNGHEHFGAFFM